MNSYHDTFVNALIAKNKIDLHFFSKEDGQILVRTCAPLDYGPSRRAKEKDDRYHLWDYDSDKKMHVLTLKPEQIKSVVPKNDNFDPKDIITWDLNKSPWFFKRDWGAYS